MNSVASCPRHRSADLEGGMDSMKKLAIARAVAVLSVCVGGAAVADANHAHKPKKVSTKLTIHLKQSTSKAKFKGKAKSKKSACKRHRKVKVIRKGHGAIGHTKTNKKGKWHLTKQAPLKTGKYFAKAPKAKRNHGKLICKSAHSKKIKVKAHHFTTTLTIQFTQSSPYSAAFSGTVGSNSSTCIGGRTITVLPPHPGGRQTIGPTTSSSSGSRQCYLGGTPPAG